MMLAPGVQMSSVFINGYLALGLTYTGGTFTEIAGSLYARRPVTLVSPDGTALVNVAGVSFGPDTGIDWGLVSWTALFDAASGGNMLLVWPQRMPIYASASRTVTISATAIQLVVPRLLAAAADSVSTTFPAGTLVGAIGVANISNVTSGATLVAGAGTVVASTSTVGGLVASNNLGDVLNPALARVNINQGDLALPFAAVIATDGNMGNVFHLTLSGTAQLGAAANLRAGASYIWRINQDTVGGHVLTFDPSFKFSSGAAPTVTATPNAVDILSALSDGVNVYATLMKDMR